MKNKLTWLHISDIHFHPNTEWRDNVTRDRLISYLKDMFANNEAPYPDLIFCTGDIAFGETNYSPLSEQYQKAGEFFDQLLSACGKEGNPLAKDRLFVVPGNHDVNRKSINTDAQETLTRWASDEKAKTHIDTINQRFNNLSIEFKDAVKRLNEYAEFVQNYLPHQTNGKERLCYAKALDLDGLKIGIAGFNSAWSCSGKEDDRTIWLSAEWQFNNAQSEIKDTDIRIGLIHHPIDWLNIADRENATRRISTDFHFWLHGHVHDQWLEPKQSHVVIGSGAVGAANSDEFGINLVSIDLSTGKGFADLHKHKRGEIDWTIAPIGKHAPRGQWSFDLPQNIKKFTSPPAVIPDSPIIPTVTPPVPKQDFKLYGRESLIKEAINKLNLQPFLLVYGLRGNGKSRLIEALAQESPLKNKKLHRFSVSPYTTANELFRQIATLLGETAEFPKAPQGDIASITAEIKHLYPNPRPAWLWIEHAHHLLNGQSFRHSEVRLLLLGLQAVLGTQWHFVLELRERPPQNLLGSIANECEVLGLDKNSLKQWLQDAAPSDTNTWSFKGDELSRINQWLGGGHGGRAHTLATQLLIDVAIGQMETPMQVLERHRDFLDEGIENRLLRDLYSNVLNADEQKLLQAFALYRSAIPYDHVDILVKHLNSINVINAWNGLDRRCLLSTNAEHSKYYLHSFIAGWLRTRQLGYDVANDEDDNNDFSNSASPTQKQLARALHLAIAECWLEQLGKKPRLSHLSMERALETFHHFIAAGDVYAMQNIAFELLRENQDWAEQRITQLYEYLFKSHAPIVELRSALEYAAHLNPCNHKVQRFLGECWAKEESWASQKALECFENACRLHPNFPQYWSNLGKALLNHGHEGAEDFLKRLEQIVQQCPNVIDDHVRAVQSDCFKLVGNTEKATALRMEHINAGGKNAVFYNDEAKARLEDNDSDGALVIINLAKQRNCANEFTDSILASMLQIKNPKEASELRMKYINTGNKNPAFYAEEALALHASGDNTKALSILDKAEHNHCANDVIASIRTKILRHADSL